MAQQIIVILIVAAAVFYIGRMLWNTVAAKAAVTIAVRIMHQDQDL